MNDITHVQRRTQAYWFVDGIAELVGGIALGTVGALMYGAEATGNENLSTVALLGMIVAFPLSAKAVHWIKDRFTHQRTGYVKYPEPSPARRRNAAIMAFVFGILFAGIAVASGDSEYAGAFGYAITIAAALGIAGTLVHRALRLSMPRLHFSAVAVLAAGVWALVEGVDFVAALGALWFALGVASLLTGSVALAGYARRTRGQGEPTP